MNQKYLFLISLLFLQYEIQNQENANQSGQFYLLKDLQILSPLQTGWYIDGDWKVIDKELCLLNYNEKNFILTNNLQINTQKMIVLFDMTITHDVSQFQNKKNLINENEVISFSISPTLYPIKKYSPYQTTFYIHGYVIFMFYKDGKGYVMVKEQFEGIFLNYQTMFSEIPFHNNKEYCQYDYRNKKSEFRIYVNWENRELILDINQKRCIQKPLKFSLFSNYKMTVSFNGYSSGKSPVKINLHKLSINKYIIPDDNRKNFHENETDLLKYLYYDREFKQKATLGHLRIIQGKIKKNLTQSFNMLELMETRSKDIEQQIEDEENSKDYSKNEIYENKELIETINSQVKKIEGIYKYNQNSLKSFEKIVQNFDNVENYFIVSDKFEELEVIVNELDSLIELNKFKNFLKNLKTLMDNSSTTTLDQINVNIQKLQENLESQQSSIWFTIISMLILGTIIFLVFLNLKKISERYKDYM